MAGDAEGDSDGLGVGAAFASPGGIVAESNTVLYVSDTGNGKIRKVETSGQVTTLASDLGAPSGLALDAAGNVIVADAFRGILSVSADGTVTVVAGSAIHGFADGDTGTAAFASPKDVAVASDGTIYVADYRNHRIRKISGGTVSTLAGRESSWPARTTTTPSSWTMRTVARTSWQTRPRS